MGFIVFLGIVILVFVMIKNSKENRSKKRQERQEKNKERLSQKIKRDKELDEIETNIQLFNISEINQKYRAIGYVESRDKYQSTAKKLICEEAYKKGANAIINLNLQTESKVVSNGGSDTAKLNKNLLDNGYTLKQQQQQISSKTIYIYTGTAVYIEDD